MKKYNKPSMKPVPVVMRKKKRRQVSLAMEMTEIRLEKKHRKQRRAKAAST